jgi:hypothetical protein
MRFPRMPVNVVCDRPKHTVELALKGSAPGPLCRSYQRQRGGNRDRCETSIPWEALLSVR